MNIVPHIWITEKIDTCHISGLNSSYKTQDSTIKCRINKLRDLLDILMEFTNFSGILAYCIIIVRISVISVAVYWYTRKQKVGTVANMISLCSIMLLTT